MLQTFSFCSMSFSISPKPWHTICRDITVFSNESFHCIKKSKNLIYLFFFCADCVIINISHQRCPVLSLAHL